MTQDEALQELRTKPVVDIATGGRAAFDVGSSRAYQLAETGALPTIQLSPGRRVVPSAVLLNKLGLAASYEPTAVA